MLIEAIKLALQSIRRNTLRSFLTVLGIIIGVGAVIAMVTIGNGTTAKSLRIWQSSAAISCSCARASSVRPGQFRCQTFQCPRPRGDQGPADQRARRGAGGAEIGDGDLRQRKPQTVVTGTDKEYFITQDWDLGRAALSSRAKCALAGPLAPGADRARKTVRPPDPSARISVSKTFLRGDRRVRSKGQSSMGTDQDDMVLLPIRAFQRRIAGNAEVRAIVSARNGVDTVKVQAGMERLLRERRNIAGDRRTISRSAT